MLTSLFLFCASSSLVGLQPSLLFWCYCYSWASVWCGGFGPFAAKWWVRRIWNPTLFFLNIKVKYASIFNNSKVSISKLNSNSFCHYNKLYSCMPINVYYKTSSKKGFKIRFGGRRGKEGRTGCRNKGFSMQVQKNFKKIEWYVLLDSLREVDNLSVWFFFSAYWMFHYFFERSTISGPSLFAS